VLLPRHTLRWWCPLVLVVAIAGCSPKKQGTGAGEPDPITTDSAVNAVDGEGGAPAVPDDAQVAPDDARVAPGEPDAGPDEPSQDCSDGNEETRACGRNGRGRAARVCVDGTWEPFGECRDPDECTDGEREQEGCGYNGRGTRERVCTDGSLPPFGACDDPDLCINGASETRSCGLNARGSSLRSCANGGWSEWGACADADLCTDGTREQQSCGLNLRGVSERSCTSGAFGAFGECSDKDTCRDGTIEQRVCGVNGRGLSERTCAGGAFGDFTPCADSDACTDGARDHRPCGLNGRGTATRTCENGAWGSAECSDSDACEDRRTEERACGLNGRGSSARSCVEGAWDTWSACVDPDECVDSQRQTAACGLNLRGQQERTCASGRFGPYGACDDPDACVDGWLSSETCGSDASGHRELSCVAGQYVRDETCACDAGQVLSCDERCVSTPALVRVKPTASACEDGLTWETAFSDLQKPLTTAWVHEIWLAEGRYYPGAVGSPLTSTFTLSRAVSLFGGFVGNETERSQRDARSHLSVLSGDLDRDGLRDAENAYHVVTVTASAVLDGLTIRDGYARDDTSDVGSLRGYGGGLLVHDASPTLRSCHVEDNRAELYGAGMHVQGTSFARIIRTIFERNVARSQYYGNGGALGIHGPADGNALTEIINCAFYDNDAEDHGGALTISGADARIVNSLFTRNRAACGGAVAVSSAEPSIINSTFVGNVSRSNCGATMYYWFSAFPRMVNSIVWDQGRSPLYAYNEYSYSSAKVSYSIVRGGHSGTGNLNQDPLLTSDGLLSSGSPARDRGDTASLPNDRRDLDGDGVRDEPIPLDLAEQPRVSGSAVDMGAYEWSAQP